tara:strand:+ start:2951 stop:3643 length:693 start_codon:yes stop_codon:yes gene_type:complete
MHQSINKNKIYFYLIIILFLSSITNISIEKNLKDQLRIKYLKFSGIEENQEIMIKQELENIIGKNIFRVDKEYILKKLEQFKYLEKINIHKKLPSELNINLYITKIIGETYRNGKKYYVGENKKFISSDNFQDVKKNPMIFGEFSADEYINLLDELKNNNVEIKNIKNFFYHKSGRWDFQNYSNEIILLPLNEYKNAIKLYKKFLNLDNKKKINSIDLRVKNQISLIYEK